MAEIDAAHARRRQHGERLRQVDARGSGVEEAEELRLLAVVWTGRIAERRTDAAEALVQQVGLYELLARRVPLAPRALVQPLRKRLRQAIRQGLRHDAVVIVVIGGKARDQLVGAEPGGYREGAHVVAH